MTQFINWAEVRASYTHESKDAEILRLKRIIKKLKQELNDSYETVTEIKREHEEDIKRLAPQEVKTTRPYLDFSNAPDLV
jgi:hypothetical protein